MQTYIEDFSDGPGGWHTWLSNKAGPAEIQIENRIVTFRSPWWVDYNHAFPGAGYLHLTMGLRVKRNRNLQHKRDVDAVAGDNRFVRAGFSNDFRDAAITLRLRGRIALRGARLQLLVQSRVGRYWVNYVLSAKPFQITPQWSDQTIVLNTDPAQWLCLGSRSDRMDFYGWGPLDKVLANVNGNIILVLFPLTVSAIGEDHGDMHDRRAGEDYDVNHDLLPEGSIMYDWIKINLQSKT